jgi:hypothetical protein
MKARLIAAILAVAMTGTAHAQSNWDWSSFPGEGEKAVLGCSDSTTDEDWVCLAVRCEAAGSLGLYVELTDLSLDERFDLVIGEQRFAVAGASRDESGPYSNRLSGEVAAIVAALKSGAAVKLDVPGGALNPGFDTVPLRGSSRALTALEAQCGITALPEDPGPARPTTPAPLSSEARAFTDQIVVEACFDATGRIEDGGAVERDLTGDGLADLVIDTSAISCDNRPTNGFCGQMSCSTDVYRRSGNGYVSELSVLGTIALGRGEPPELTATEDLGEPYTVRWSGESFE